MNEHEGMKGMNFHHAISILTHIALIVVNFDNLLTQSSCFYPFF